MTSLSAGRAASSHPRPVKANYGSIEPNATAARHAAAYALTQYFGHQIAGTAAEARARMGRSADVMKPRHRRAVIDRVVERPPDEELVDPAESPIGIAADQIHIHAFEIPRRIRLACDHIFAKAIDMRGEDRFDSIGELFAHGFCPLAIRWRGDRARGIALDETRRFRQLQ